VDIIWPFSIKIVIKLTPNPTIGIPKPEFILYVDCRLSGDFDMAVVLEAQGPTKITAAEIERRRIGLE
jgi:hypothetical protein